MSAERITEDKLRSAFTMTPEELDSAVNTRSEQLTYEVAFDLLEGIVDNVAPPPAVTSGIDRITWVVRCAFLAGFRDAATIFNDAAIMGIQVFFGGGKTA